MSWLERRSSSTRLGIRDLISATCSGVMAGMSRYEMLSLPCCVASCIFFAHVASSSLDADDIFVRVTGVVLPGAVDGNSELCSQNGRPRPDERRVADLTSASRFARLRGQLRPPTVRAGAADRTDPQPRSVLAPKPRQRCEMRDVGETGMPTAMIHRRR